MKIAIVTGIHGHEKTPVLIGALVKHQKLEIDVYGPVNKKGFKENLRENPQDGLDMNRFCSNRKGATNEIMKSLLNRLRKYDIVIDLHNLVGQNTVPTGSIFSDQEDIKKYLKFYNQMGIRYVDSLDIEENSLYKRSLAYQLIKDGVTTLIIELPDLYCIQAKGIRDFLKGLCALQKRSPRQRLISKLYISTEKVEASSDGFFLPTGSVRPGARIRPDLMIGTFITIKGKSIELCAKKAGIIQNYSLPRYVRKGELLCNIVVPDKDASKRRL